MLTCLLGETDDPEEDKDRRGDDEGQLPGGEPLHGDVLDLPRREQAAHVDGREAHPAGHRDHRLLGLGVAPGDKDLEGEISFSIEGLEF